MNEQAKTPDTDNKFPKDDTVYILVTQCLQNGFLLADDSRLVMDQDVVAKLLLPSPSKITSPSPAAFITMGRSAVPLAVR